MEFCDRLHALLVDECAQEVAERADTQEGFQAAGIHHTASYIICMYTIYQHDIFKGDGDDNTDASTSHATRKGNKRTRNATDEESESTTDAPTMTAATMRKVDSLIANLQVSHEFGRSPRGVFRNKDRYKGLFAKKIYT